MAYDTLTLALNKKWFDLIKSGDQTEAYKCCSKYWIFRFARLCGEFEYDSINGSIIMQKAGNLKCKNIVFTLGSPRADDISRRICFHNPKIKVGEGNPEWGAEKGTKYFILTWDK